MEQQETIAVTTDLDPLACNRLLGGRVRVIRNRHCSAVAAVMAWLDGSLWGDPITLSSGNIHVYGLWRKRRRVSVQFTAEKIVVLRF